MRHNANLMLTHQVARVLGVHKRTLNRYISRGKIPAPQPSDSNGYLYWTEADIAEAKSTLRELALKGER